MNTIKDQITELATPKISYKRKLEIIQNSDLFKKHRDPKLIKLPKKLITRINKLPYKVLSLIHKDKDISKELLLLLSNEIFRINILKHSINQKTSKELNTKKLRKIFTNKTYYSLIKILKEEGIIDNSKSYKVDVRSKEYWITEEFLSNTKEYTFNTPNVINKIYKRVILSYSDNYFNIDTNEVQIPALVLSQYMFNTQSVIPTPKEIEKEIEHLNGTTFRGRTFITRNALDKRIKKDKKLNKKDFYVFENSVEFFNVLTENGKMEPRGTGFRAGGRVVTSFTLMPTWIRKMIRKNGKELFEI